MNPCEKILAGMKPAIRAYYQGRWIRKAPVKVAEDLYREYRRRKGLS
ncbi:MAG: hypothetical protein LUQ36_08720 [Methanoregula sp.]|nr:hypothetical protein [Methanoregula sp.]